MKFLYNSNFRSLVDRVDAFGLNVNLNFNGHSTVKTAPGAFFTVLFAIMIAILISETMIEFSQGVGTTINSDTYIDINDVQNSFYPFQHGLKIALGFPTELPESIGWFEATFQSRTPDDRYVANLKLKPVAKEWPELVQKYPEFSNLVTLDSLEAERIFMLGNYFSKGNFHYARINFVECTGSDVCASDEDKQAYLSSQTINVIYQENFLDSSKAEKV